MLSRNLEISKEEWNDRDQYPKEVVNKDKEKGTEI